MRSPGFCNPGKGASRLSSGDFLPDLARVCRVILRPFASTMLKDQAVQRVMTLARVVFETSCERRLRPVEGTMSEKKEKMSPEYVKRTIAKALRVTSGLKAGEMDVHRPHLVALYAVRMPDDPTNPF